MGSVLQTFTLYKSISSAASWPLFGLVVSGLWSVVSDLCLLVI